MRENKYRGKSLNNGEWVYGLPHVTDTVGEGYTGRAIQTQYSDHRPISIQIDKATLTQFTGLTDRNGVEIYEGDVLKLNNRLMKIKFMGEYNFGYILISVEDSRNTVMLNVDHLKNISVIGNIYEHPHLLEGVK